MLKPATLKGMANQLGVSISTVSRALIDHDSISQETKQRVRKLAADLKYTPNKAAVVFRTGRTFTIGLIVPDLSDAFFTTALTAIQEIAAENNYTVLVTQSLNSEECEVAQVQKMIDLRVDGLLVALAKNTKRFGHFSKLRDCGIPVVFFDRIPPYFNIHSVCCDIESATERAVDFLFGRGHRRVGIINGPSRLLSSRQRTDGYIRALSRQEIFFDPSLLTECDLSEVGVEKAMIKLLKLENKPTAIITFNDYVAMYAIRKIRSQNIHMAQSIDFVSFSNLPMLRFMEHAPVATINQFPELQGKIAAQILTELIKPSSFVCKKERQIKNVVLEAKLILGAS